MVCKRGPPLLSHLPRTFPILLHSCGCSSGFPNALHDHRDSLDLPRAQAKHLCFSSSSRKLLPILPFNKTKQNKKTQKNKKTKRKRKTRKDSKEPIGLPGDSEGPSEILRAPKENRCIVTPPGGKLTPPRTRRRHPDGVVPTESERTASDVLHLGKLEGT